MPYPVPRQGSGTLQDLLHKGRVERVIWYGAVRPHSSGILDNILVVF